ncbi:MAG: hypothetical protein PHS60_14405, partial [Zavarzinia sp.]|nr:hypothetical protein [Zavarzinia sp.]
MTLNDRNKKDYDWSDGDELPFEPAPIRRRRRTDESGTDRSWLRKWGYNVGVLIVPSVVAAIYFYGFASPIYETDTVLSLRNSNASAGGGVGFSGALAALTGVGDMGRAKDESFALVTNVRSREALIELDETLDLRTHFADPSINYFQRLPDDASFEGFYSYYGDFVAILYDEVTGQIVLHTRAFDKDLAYQMAQVIIRRGEALVNQFNQRARSDLMHITNAEVTDAEERLRKANAAVTQFRLDTGIMDPMIASQAIGTIITTLMSEIAKIQAEITAETQLSSGRVTPQLESLRNKLQALQAQSDAEQKRLTGRDESMAKLLAPYQSLLTDQEIARQTYIASLTAQHASLAEAKRQQLYLIDIVAPTLSQEARRPQRLRAIMLTFL